MMTRIENPSHDPFLSDVLRAVATQAERDSGVVSEVVTTAVPDTKGPVVEAIGIGMLSNAAWDALKFAVRRLRHRSDYQPTVRVEVDGAEAELGSLERDDPGQ